MATYVKGAAVANATSYELFEKSGENYNSLATANSINFEVSALGLAPGNHSLVVQAHADGYESSDYSNEEVYTVIDDSISIVYDVFANNNGEIANSSGGCTSIIVTNLQSNTEYKIHTTNSEIFNRSVVVGNTTNEFENGTAYDKLTTNLSGGIVTFTTGETTRAVFAYVHSPKVEYDLSEIVVERS